MFIDTINLTVNSNDDIKQTLDALCGSGRFPHALLFEGEDSFLTEAYALHTAMRFLCKSEKKPCMNCSGCRKTANLTHIDLIVCGQEGEKSYNIDKVREIRKSAYIKPNESEKTVFIMKNADTIPEKSQNALLKIIEEPPKHAVFIFCCENRFRLLETILSRVFSFKVSKTDENTAVQIIKALDEGFEEEKIRETVKTVENNIQKTLGLLKDDNGIFTSAENIFKAMEKRDIYSVMLFIGETCKNKITADVMNQLKMMLIKKCAECIKDEKRFFLTAEQTSSMAELLDKAVFMANQNANKSILPAYVASQFDIIINKKRMEA